MIRAEQGRESRVYSHPKILYNVLISWSWWVQTLRIFFSSDRLWFAWSPYLCFITVLSCQPIVTVTSCFVYKVFRDLESIDHLFINPIRRIGLIHKWSVDSVKLKWIVKVNVLLYNCKQMLRHCHSWLARQYINWFVCFFVLLWFFTSSWLEQVLSMLNVMLNDTTQCLRWGSNP